MVVLTKLCLFGQFAFFLVDHKGKYFFNGPRVCPRLMVVLTQTLFVWAICIFLLDHKGEYFSMA